MENGVWRTIRGRRVFIRDGEDLDSAMKRSGKFERKQKIQNDETEDIKQLNDISKSGKINQEQYDNARKETVEFYKKRLKEKDSITDIPEAYRHYEQDYENELMTREYFGVGTSKMPEEKDYLPGGKKWNNEWESAREYKISKDNLDNLKLQGRETRAREIDKINKISKEEYDKTPKDYKGTLKELVDTAEFRGESKEKERQYWESKGYDVDKDKTILKYENGGTTLQPVKIEDSSPMSEWSDTTGSGYSDLQMKSYKSYLKSAYGTDDESIINAGKPSDERVSIEKYKEYVDKSFYANATPGQKMNRLMNSSNKQGELSKWSLSELRELGATYGIKNAKQMSQKQLLSALISMFNK